MPLPSMLSRKNPIQLAVCRSRVAAVALARRRRSRVVERNREDARAVLPNALPFTVFVAVSQ